MLQNAKYQLIYFLIAGTFGFFADIFAFWILTKLFEVHTARVFAFFAAVTVTWVINKNLTFNTDQNNEVNFSLVPALGIYFKYILVSAIGFSLNFIVFSWYIHYHLSTTDIYTGVVLGSLTGMAFNFILMKFYIFKK